MRARSTRFAAAVLVVGVATLAPTSAAAVPEAPAGFDQDPFSIAGDGSSVRGSVDWSRGGDPREIRGRISGRVRSSGGDCARVEIAWLNSANSTIRTAGARACGGNSESFGASYASSALACVRVRLLVAGEQAGPSRLLCAGGT
ncbi:MAG: hypothetical protein ACT4QF_00730 [Sporichthyaceae bacterium]